MEEETAPELRHGAEWNTKAEDAGSSPPLQQQPVEGDGEQEHGEPHGCGQCARQLAPLQQIDAARSR